MANCIYCGGPAKSIEHPLPAAFGEFSNAPLLTDRLCVTCNSKRLGILDEQFARCGPEAVLRRILRVEGRDTHKKVNPHHRGSAGGGRLATIAYDSSVGCEVEIELIGGREARQLCQIIFKEASGAVHRLLLPPTLTDPAKIRAEFEKLPIADLATTEFTFFADPDERQRLEPLLATVWPKLNFGSSKPGATVFPGAMTEMRITVRYFQAIAKMAFHYFLTQFPDLDGSEPCFSDIRSFLTAADAKLRLADKFIGRRPTPLLANMLDGARPDGWVAHVLTAEANGDAYLGHVQIFVSEDYRAAAYTVTLATGLGQVQRAAYGHAYRYYPACKQGRFSGEASPLSTMFSSIPKQPLLPLFDETDSQPR